MSESKAGLEQTSGETQAKVLLKCLSSVERHLRHYDHSIYTPSAKVTNVGFKASLLLVSAGYFFGNNPASLRTILVHCVEGFLCEEV